MFLTQSDIAARMGASATLVSHIETGHQIDPDWIALYRWAVMQGRER